MQLVEMRTRKYDERKPHNPTTDASLRALEARDLEKGPDVPPPQKPQTAAIFRQTPGRFFSALFSAMFAPISVASLVWLLGAVHAIPPLPGLMPGLIGWTMLAACAALLKSRSTMVLSMLGLAAGAPALAACLALNFQVVRVEGNSMLPTLSPGDVLLVDLRGNPRDSARPGEEIYVLGGEDVQHGGEPAIKRLVGVPGDKLEVDQGTLIVNGTPARQTALVWPGVLWGGVALDADEYFFLGDNPQDSRDSREFGPVHSGQVLGRAVWKIRGAKSPGPVH